MCRSCPRLLSGPSPFSSRSTCLPTTSYPVCSRHTGRGRNSVAPSVVRHPGGSRRTTSHSVGHAGPIRHAAFDCVDHTILLQRLQLGAGLTDAVLEWISSFRSGRTQQIAYNGELSRVQPVLFGVPQGSVLGPLLYVLYTAELFHIVAHHQLRLHMYADDSQICLHSSQ